MPDYGHALRFGTFITPANAPADRPVELAVLSEELGFDLVTFQDHPYQPAFHDTWTLLTWVAARTQRIHLSGNVLNLPLRQPAVLARAAASLDLLSGGRFALGLGAGGFWDPIAAMGGRRLTPGQAVTALDEAIDVIRGIWDTTNRAPLRAGGDYYRVEGAKRGPTPAHAIPIWLGAYKPRMLRLIAEKGDGWLPSMSYMQPGDLERGNKAIDDAARAVGRFPREITRLLNVPPDLTVDALVDLAIDQGVSVFVVMADDPRVMERWAQQIIPVVRERVGEARASQGITTGTRIRPAAALTKRVEGIDYDAVPESLADTAVEPGDHGYARYQSAYMRGGRPGLILRPQTIEEVQDAVRYARTQRDVPLGIFSAGHGISGRSLNEGGLVIDVGALNAVEPLGGQRVRTGPGARWADVAKVLSPLGLAITSGDYGGVGVGGLATAGGIGWFAREHGLTIDHLRSVDVVTADGELVRANDQENADLFWAMRGAGANFGIGVSFEFDAARVGKVAFAQLVFEADDTADFIERWGTAMEESDRSVTGEVILGAHQPGRPYVAQAMILVDSDDPDTVIDRLQPIAAIAPILDQSVGIATYDQIIGAFLDESGQRGRGEPRSHTGMIEHLNSQFARDAADFLASGATYFFQIRCVGGAASDVAADATAWGWRDANFGVSAMGTRASDLDAGWQRLLPHFNGLYLSFETDTSAAAVARAFPPDHLERLRELKSKWDPTGLFRDNFFIPPTGST